MKLIVSPNDVIKSKPTSIKLDITIKLEKNEFIKDYLYLRYVAITRNEKTIYEAAKKVLPYFEKMDNVEGSITQLIDILEGYVVSEDEPLTKGEYDAELQFGIFKVVGEKITLETIEGSCKFRIN